MVTTKILHSFGKNDLVELDWELLELAPNEILVRTVYTGICSSDAAMYSGKTAPLPVGIFGHEGVGVVEKIGTDITDVAVGDPVATRGDPAFGYLFKCTNEQYVKIPALNPKYIIEPIACAINVAAEARLSKEVLILGSGCLSTVAAQFLAIEDVSVTVVGKSLIKVWDKLSNKCIRLVSDISEISKKYETIVELSGRPEYFKKISEDLLMDSGLLLYGSTPSSPITTNFFANSWGNHMIQFPSPRRKDFKEIMADAVKLVENEDIDVSYVWSHNAKRSSMKECEEMFKLSSTKSPDFVRAYIDFTR